MVGDQYIHTYSCGKIEVYVRLDIITYIGIGSTTTSVQ